MPMTPVLEARHIDKYFTKPVSFHVLKDIGFGIQPGEFASIMGKSGSGKSTLLYILSTMDTEYTGSLYLKGELLTGKPANRLSAIRNAHIGFVFQSFQLLSNMTAHENVRLPMELLGIAEAESRAQELLEMVGLSAEQADKYPHQLSGGQARRVGIARALANDPAIILADEPTGNLDSSTGERIIELLFALNTEQRTTLVMVTHDEQLASRCERRIRLESGRILSEECRT